MSKSDAFFIGMLAGILGLTIVLGCILPEDRKEAIQRGFAEYVIIDSTSGETEFRWKSKCGDTLGRSEE